MWLLIVIVVIIIALLIFSYNPFDSNQKWDKLIFSVSPNGTAYFRTAELLDNITNSDEILEPKSPEDRYDYLYHDLITLIGLSNHHLPQSYVTEIEHAIMQLERNWPQYAYHHEIFPHRLQILQKIKQMMFWNIPTEHQSLWYRLMHLTTVKSPKDLKS